jgi:hypothetical protein
MPAAATAADRVATPRPTAVLAAGVAPLAAGRLVPLDGTAVDGPALVCPFRAATGLPCPLCGGTRAMALAAHGDGRFLSYGAVWVAAAVVAVAVGLAGLVRAALRRGRADRSGRSSPRRVALGAAAVVALAWAWALAHQDAITEA